VSDIVLRLFFHGLIAFVPNSPVTDNPNRLTAYVLRHNDHLPAISFEISDASDCVEGDLSEDAYCVEESTRKDGRPRLCACYLGSDVEISLEPGPILRGRFMRPGPLDDRLNSEDSAVNFSWLVRVLNVDRGAAQIKSPSEIDRDKSVLARMSFGWESAQACHLDQRSNAGCEVGPGRREYQVHSVEFLRGDASGRPGHVQPLSEYAMFEVHLPRRPIKLVLRDRGTGKRIEHGLGCGVRKRVGGGAQDCPDILVANLAERECGNCDVGRHFLAYYQLSNGQPEGRIPFRLQNVAFSVGPNQLFTCVDDPLRRRKQTVDLQSSYSTAHDSCSKEFLAPPTREEFLSRFDKAVPRGVESRIICPMAMFEP
jgi:hypothetical protein